MRGIREQLIEYDKRLSELEEPVKTPLPLLILFFLLGCSQVEAQEADSEAPQNVRIDGGYNAGDPWLRISWDTPAPVEVISGMFTKVDDVIVDIDTIEGKGRTNPPKNTTPVHMRADYALNWVWLGYESPALRRAGCSVTNRYVIFTGRCLDRYFPRWALGFKNGFLAQGQTYEVQVYFSREWPKGTQIPDELNWSSYSHSPWQTYSLPAHATPTPRPKPTRIPWATPTPIPDDRDREIRELRARVSELERKLQDLTFRVGQLDGRN